jgi:hypothetical protein
MAGIHGKSGFLLWSAPVLIAIAHDARHIRRIHPVYVAALGAFVVRLWGPPLIAPTPQWAECTARLLAPFGE